MTQHIVYSGNGLILKRQAGEVGNRAGYSNRDAEKESESEMESERETAAGGIIALLQTRVNRTGARMPDRPANENTGPHSAECKHGFIGVTPATRCRRHDGRPVDRQVMCQFVTIRVALQVHLADAGNRSVDERHSRNQCRGTECTFRGMSCIGCGASTQESARVIMKSRLAQRCGAGEYPAELYRNRNFFTT